MPLRKPVVALCCPLHPCASPPSPQRPSFTSPLRPSPRRARALPKPQQPARQQRCYAAGGSREHEEERAPEWPRNPKPSPYDIFAMGKTAPYTKKRFYQLVKLYHPDKHHHHHHHLHHHHNHNQHGHHGHHHHQQSPQPQAGTRGDPSSSAASAAETLRTERYRLVVAANDILSSPSKRRLYDATGHGWLYAPTPASYAHRSHEDLRRADRSWRAAPGSAARNATWEDWERWHRAQNPGAYGEAQDARPVYMSHGMFASLVVVLCMVGALVQESRALGAGQEYVEMRETRHREIGMDLGRRGLEMAGMGREERVDAFVREREMKAARNGVRLESIPNTPLHGGGYRP